MQSVKYFVYFVNKIRIVNKNNFNEVESVIKKEPLIRIILMKRNQLLIRIINKNH